jgi:hypothetical protein
MEDGNSHPLYGETRPQNNRFIGQIKNGESSPSVAFSFDYRDFFKDNFRYNAALSRLSIVMANIAYHDAHLIYDEKALSTEMSSIYAVMEVTIQSPHEKRARCRYYEQYL